MTRKNRNSRIRKDRNKKKREDLLSQKSDRVRRDFFGKSRKGDLAEVSFQFSGVPVVVDHDSEEPGADLHGKTKVQQALWEIVGDDFH